MRLIWHIILKDAARVRWTIVLWIAAMATRYLVGVHLLRAVGLNAADLQQWTAYDDWLWVTQIVVAYLLAGWIVQEDLLVGTQAFWMTRPISRRRLLAAKLLGVGLLVCVLPAVVALPWWLVCGYGWGDVAAAAAETVFWFGCVSAIAVALASLTDDLARFVLYSFILLLVAGTYAIALVAMQSWMAPTLQRLTDGRVQTLVWVCAIWVLLSCGIAAAYHFMTRRTWCAWILFVGGLVAMVVPVQFWSWDLSDWFKARPPTVPEFKDISVKLVAAHLGPKFTALYDHKDHRPLKLMLYFDGIPKEYDPSGFKLESTWQWPDGVRYAGIGVFGEWWVGPTLKMGWKALALHDEQQWDYAARRAYLEFCRARQERLIPGWSELTYPPEKGSWATRVDLPPSLAEKMRRESPTWRAHVQGDLLQEKVAAMLPLRVGAKAGRDVNGLKILKFERRDKGRIAMTVSQSWSTAGKLGIFDSLVVSRSMIDERRYVVFSQDKSRVIYPWESAFFAHRIGTVAVVRRELMLYAPVKWIGYTPPRNRWEPDPTWPGWLEHATLAKVAYEMVGHFEQTLRSRQFAVEPAANAAATTR